MAYIVLSKQLESQRARIDHPARNFRSRQYNTSLVMRPKPLLFKYISSFETELP